jgi:hypothetical protein
MFFIVLGIMAGIVLIFFLLVVFTHIFDGYKSSGDSRSSPYSRYSAGGGGSPYAQCSKCGMPMTMLSGAMVRTSMLGGMNGCFVCGSCGRVTCYDCSDNRIPCDCGAMAWVQKSYISGHVHN